VAPVTGARFVLASSSSFRIDVGLSAKLFCCFLLGKHMDEEVDFSGRCLKGEKAYLYLLELITMVLVGSGGIKLTYLTVFV